jgi:uroporphyrin-III C-methyltransferase/precorrin-2 dehydrogenase/sirohydrochlorin ferrochelatase
MPAAVIENGTRADQRVVVSTLEGISAEVARARLAGPALIVIGTVVTLRDRCSWLSGMGGASPEAERWPAVAVQS